jgi:hypothetical protein
MTQQQNHHRYGSINEDIPADEETALVPRADNDEESLYVRVPTYRKLYGLKSLLVAVATVAAFAFLAIAGVPPLRGTASAATGSDDAGSSGPPIFDWKAYGANIKQYWAEKKADWSKKIAEMKETVSLSLEKEKEGA